MEVCIWVDKVLLFIKKNQTKDQMAEDISSKLKKLLLTTGIDEAKVTDEASFIDDLKLIA